MGDVEKINFDYIFFRLYEISGFYLKLKFENIFTIFSNKGFISTLARNASLRE